MILLDRARYSPPPFARVRRNELELIREITATAAAIADARDFFRRAHRAHRGAMADAVCHRVLQLLSLDRGPRTQHAISSQTAQQLAVAGERAGDIDLPGNPDDRRIRQLELTGKGKAALERSRSREKTWVAVLLNGLDRREMHATTHILRVIRHRLLRDERQRTVRAQAHRVRR